MSSDINAVTNGTFKLSIQLIKDKSKFKRSFLVNFELLFAGADK
jgi:hypothetical protein